MRLYGYRRCSTCREAQKTLEANGAKVEFHDIVEHAPSEETIRFWVKQSQRPISDFINTRGTVYRDKGLKTANLSEEEWIVQLAQEGKLIKRPILVTARDEVLVGYHEGAYRRLALGE